MDDKSRKDKIKKRSIDLKKSIPAFTLLVTLFYIVLFPQTELFQCTLADILFKIRSFHLSDIVFNNHRVFYPLEPSKEVYLITIDEKTYKSNNLRFGIDKLPRKYVAELLNKLASFKPKAVALDAYYKVELEPEEDEALAEAIGRLPAVMPCGEYPYSDPGNGNEQKVRSYVSAEIFQSKAKSYGHIWLNHDFSHTGYVRYFDTDEQGNKSLSEASALLGNPEIKLPERRSLINFYGKFGTIRHASAYDILNDTLSQKRLNKLKNKYFVVGVYDENLSGIDLHETIFGPLSGAEIHATMLSNILEQEWISSPTSLTARYLQALILLILSVIIISLKPAKAVLFTLSVIMLWCFTAYYVFVKFFYLLPDILLILCLITVLIAYIFITYVWEAFNASVAIDTVKRFAGSEVAQELEKDPANIAIKSKECMLYAMSTDLAGFTHLSETLGAEKMMDLLNRYFSLLAELAAEKKGTIMGYGGDAMYITWGSFDEPEDPAYSCISCAVEMQKKLQELRKSSPELPELSTRIAVDYGKAIVGTLGGTERLTYTCIGTPMNLSSRLQKVNDELGTRIIVSESVKEQLNSEFNILPVGNFIIRGIKEIQKLSVILDTPIRLETRKFWENALQEFEGKRWQNAVNLLKEIKESQLKKAVSLYIETCNELIKNPPAEDWQPAIISKA